MSSFLRRCSNWEWFGMAPEQNPYLASVIRRLVAQNGEIDIPSSGTSMFPLIKEGYICRFVALHNQMPKKGDILLAESVAGNLVGHRLMKFRHEDGELLIICKGDSNIRHDPPVPLDRIIGRLTVIRKRRTAVQAHRGIAGAWGQMLAAFPVLSYGIRFYLRLKRKLRQEGRRFIEGEDSSA